MYPEAIAAKKKEWKNLRDKDVWDESTVREWSQVAAAARAGKFTVHMGMLFGLMVEKGSELPEGSDRSDYLSR